MLKQRIADIVARGVISSFRKSFEGGEGEDFILAVCVPGLEVPSSSACGLVVPPTVQHQAMGGKFLLLDLTSSC